MKSTHLSLYCGAFQPLPSTLVPTFLSETWLYLSKSSLGPITASAVLFMLSGMRVLVWFSTNIKFPQGEPHVGTRSPLRLLGSPSSGLVDPTPSHNYPSFFVIQKCPHTDCIPERDAGEGQKSAGHHRLGYIKILNRFWSRIKLTASSVKHLTLFSCAGHLS